MKKQITLIILVVFIVIVGLFSLTPLFPKRPYNQAFKAHHFLKIENLLLRSYDYEWRDRVCLVITVSDTDKPGLNNMQMECIRR